MQLNLRAPMKSAERSLISLKDSKSENLFRLIPSRSDLFRHHLIFYPRNLWRSILLWLNFNYATVQAGA